MSSSEYVYDLVWPDTIVSLWNRFRNPTAMSDEDVDRAWSALERLGFVYLSPDRGNSAPNPDDMEMWTDYLKDLMLEASWKPYRFSSQAVIYSEFRKYKVGRSAKCDKEVYDAVSSGVNRLVREGVLNRSPSPTINQETLIWFAEAHALKKASQEYCGAKIAEVKEFGAGIEERDWDTAHRRMLTPRQAEDLIVSYMEAIGRGFAIRMADLVACAKEKVRGMLPPVVLKEECEHEQDDYPSERGSGDSKDEQKLLREAKRFKRAMELSGEMDGQEPLENGGDAGPNGIVDEEVQEDLAEWHMKIVAENAADRIFCQIEQELGARHLDLLRRYVVPKSYGKEVALKDFGAPNTVRYQVCKLYSVIKRVLYNVLPTEDGKPLKKVALLTMQALGVRCGALGSAYIVDNVKE